MRCPLLVLLPPRTSALFPYTTLFRSKARGASARAKPVRSPPESASATVRCAAMGAPDRSEEHTSELESHSELVSRLLLEMKSRRQHQRESIASAALANKHDVPDIDAS